MADFVDREQIQDLITRHSSDLRLSDGAARLLIEFLSVVVTDLDGRGLIQISDLDRLISSEQFRDQLNRIWRYDRFATRLRPINRQKISGITMYHFLSETSLLYRTVRSVFRYDDRVFLILDDK